jgi:DNA-binding transcriptional regulator YiaG
MPTGKRRRPVWNAEGVRALREHLGMTQHELAEELNVRQQTVSEWETGQYRPRGASERLLSLVAERAEFAYGAGQGSGAQGQE